MGDMELCPDYIDELTEIWHGFNLMDKYDVPKENCLSLHDMKERLKLHYYRSMGQARTTEAVSLMSYSYRAETAHEIVK